MKSQRTPHVTLYGNLGADPETRTLKGRAVTREYYDPIIDEIIIEEVVTPERQIRIASLAVNATDEEGKKITRWKRLVDFEDHLKTYRKGDRLKVRGYFRDRQYIDNEGESRTIQEFIVTAANLETLMIREQAA